MKKLILCILSGVCLLWSEPKVIGIFGGESCPWSKELREDVWETPSFQALLTAAGIQKEEKPAQNEPETPMLVLYSEHDFEGEEARMQNTFLKWYPNAKLECCKAAGHYPMQETPVYLASRIERYFLTRL